MKIVLAMPSLRVSGATVLFELADRLSDKGHDVQITCLDKLEPSPYPLKTPPQKLQDGLESFKEADVIIAYYPVCAFYINDLDVNAKKFYFLTDDVTKFYTEEIFKAKYPKLDKDRIKIEYEKQKQYITASYQLPFTYLVTNNSLSYLLKNQWKRKVFTIPIGVNHNLFYPDMAVLKGDKVRILVEGNLLPYKGVQDVNRALSDLRGFELWTMSNTKFTIKSDKHWINPTIIDLKKILASCDILIKGNHEDGIADLQAQAMACGCTVLTTKTSGSEMFCNKKNSVIVKIGDYKQLSKELKKLIDDKELREKLVREGLITAKKLNWDKSVLKLESILKS